MKPEMSRPVVEFHPDIWADHFASFSPLPALETTEYTMEHGKLKEEIRKNLVAGLEKPWQQLELIDSVQRLGVAYHFEHELEILLQKIQQNLDTCLGQNDTLHGVSLLFRLLRQSGLPISCDVFKKFKDENGDFKENLSKDVEGMLSLHEASNLRVHGEDILEEAFDFTKTHLKSIATDDDSDHSPLISLAAQARKTLKYPVVKNIPRLETRYYISIYQQRPSHDIALITIAKLDFNTLQKLHQMELSQIVRWWKDLEIPKRLPFARDRIVALYFWIVGVYYEPCYALARKLSTKVIALISLLDDIYDAYGTIQELELLTQAIQRWDRNAMEEVGLNNECIKVYYQISLDIYDEIAEDMAKLGKSYRLHYAIEMMKKQGRVYLAEARWLYKKYTPTVEEYLEVGIDSSTFPLLILTSLLGMGDGVSKEDFEWAFAKPKMVVASSLVSRLVDDIVTHDFERQRFHVDSAIECYMKQHGATQEEAVGELSTKIAGCWKDINEAFIRPTQAPEAVLMRALNMTRLVHVFYLEADGYTFAHLHMKDFIADTLIHHIPLN